MVNCSKLSTTEWSSVEVAELGIENNKNGTCATAQFCV